MTKMIVLAIFVLVTAAVGVYCAKAASSVSGFVLGGRNVGPWLTAFAYGTSYFSAVVFVGYAGQFGYSYGVAATWIGIGNALLGSLLAWVVLGRRTRIMTKHLDAATMPEFFEKRYDSRGMKLVSSLIIFVFLIPYSASVYKGLSGLFSNAFGIGERFFVWVIVGMAVLTGIYVIIGGYAATALNDFIQGIVMIVGIVAVVLTVLNKTGGYGESMNLLSAFSADKVPGLRGAYTSFFGPDPIGLLGVVILTSLGAWGLPQMIHKFYTIKNERAIKTGTVVSTVFALIVAGGSYFMGAFGRLSVTSEQITGENGAIHYDKIVPAMLGDLPDLLMGVVLVLVMSASMSTLSSLVISSSSTFTIDFLKGSFFKNMSNRMQVLLIRIFVAVFLVLSVVLAVLPNNPITSLMSWSWGALAGSFLGPFVLGLFWRGVTKAGVWASFITGVGITMGGFILQQCGVAFSGGLAILNSPINIGALSMIVSLIIVPLVSLVSPKLKKAHLDNAFDCYNEKVVAEHVHVLEEEAE